MTTSQMPNASASSVQAGIATGAFSEEAFQAHLAAEQSMPTWWVDAKKAAWQRFLSLPMPGRTDETWRFSNLAGLSLNDYRPAAPVRPGENLGEHIDCDCAARLVFANNTLIHREVRASDFGGTGVIVEPLRYALIHHGELVRQYLNQQHTNLGSEKFRALHTAFVHDGVFVYIPKGVELTAPIVAYHHAHGNGSAVFPHTLVVAEEQSRATVVEIFSSLEAEAQQFAAGVNDLFAGPGSQLTYIAAQAWSANTLSFQNNALTAQRDAKMLSLNLHLGGRQARHESHSRLQGPGAHSEMLALSIAQKAQEFDQRTLQTHQAPHTSSNLLYKNALFDKARTIFSGLIVVEPDAQKTDAYQSNRNLMLSDDAEANSLPGLEIQANDVRCSHGATTGRIDPEQEFYLESRGIRKDIADELLVFGFFEEVLGKIENAPLHDALRELIRSRMK